MSSIWASKGWLEVGKFALYVSIPAALTYATTDSNTIHKLMGFRSYVVYPPEGPRPPSPEEFREMVARERAQKKQQQ
ncbi:uncharacterized protein LOC141841504 [Curcuma longa]|uniref:uncharacterized protein LOC141841504 n=1 Tax=Curcuma longa TaxID=136217 RepID=UPI003D9E5204